MIVYGKLSKKYLTAIDYFASALLSSQLKPHIIVTIKFNNKLPVLGFTEVDGYNSKGKPREFILELKSKQSEKELLKTLAHEMTHVAQYAYGKLNEKGNMWLSRKLDYDSVPYHKRPWEKEAFKMEKKLYKEFVNEQ